jgi:hypothetical protein
MYITNFHNLTNEKIGKINYYSKVQILTAYLEVCTILGVRPDDIYAVSDVDNIEIEDLKYIISFITIYNNIYKIFQEDKHIFHWFIRIKPEIPFNSKTPLQAMIDDDINILKIRVYTNALVVHLEEITNGVTHNDRR